MLKNKFMQLPSNDADFEIISDSQAASLVGGCNKLYSCGTYEGPCSKLTFCTVFTMKIQEADLGGVLV